MSAHQGSVYFGRSAKTCEHSKNHTCMYVCMCVYTQRPEEAFGVPLPLSTLLPWGSVPWTWSEAGAKQALESLMPWPLSSAPLEILALMDGSSSLGGCWVSELRYQYLHSMCSYPVSHLFSLKYTFFKRILQFNLAWEMYWCNGHCFLWPILLQNLKTAIFMDKVISNI